MGAVETSEKQTERNMLKVDIDIKDDREGLEPTKTVGGHSQEPAEKGRDKQAPSRYYIDIFLLSLF